MDTNLYLHDFGTKLVEPLILLGLVLQGSFRMVLCPWKAAAHLYNLLHPLHYTIILLSVHVHAMQVPMHGGHVVTSRDSKLGCTCNRPARFPDQT